MIAAAPNPNTGSKKCAGWCWAKDRVPAKIASFDKNPELWLENYAEEQQALRDNIVKAKELLPNVTIEYDLRVKISEVCSQLDVDGLRGDIVTNRAAKAYAAYNLRDKVTVEDISKIITLCLRHRLRKDPLESIDSGSKVEKVFNEIFELN